MFLFFRSVTRRGDLHTLFSFLFSFPHQNPLTLPRSQLLLPHTSPSQTNLPHAPLLHVPMLPSLQNSYPSRVTINILALTWKKPGFRYPNRIEVWISQMFPFMHFPFINAPLTFRVSSGLARLEGFSSRVKVFFFLGFI